MVSFFLDGQLKTGHGLPETFFRAGRNMSVLIRNFSFVRVAYLSRDVNAVRVNRGKMKPAVRSLNRPRPFLSATKNENRKRFCRAEFLSWFFRAVIERDLGSLSKRGFKVGLLGSILHSG